MYTNKYTKFIDLHEKQTTMATTVRIVLNTTSAMRKDGTFPVCLCISHERKRHYISLFNAKPEQFTAKSRVNSSFPNFHAYNKLIINSEYRASEIIVEMKNKGVPFDFQKFKIEFSGAKNSLLIVDCLEKHLQSLVAKGKVGTSEKFLTLQHLFKKYKPQSKIIDLTPKFLFDFESFLRARPVKDMTISIYMRTLRALINKLIADGLFEADKYPFGKGKYSLAHLDTTSRKRAIDKESIKKIEGYETLEGYETFAKHIFLFSYYQRGMNITDIASLKWSDLQDDKIHYVRQKTGTKFVIGVHKNSLDILKAYKGNNPLSKKYIFPMLTEGLSEMDRMKQVRRFTKRVNEHLKKIAEKLGLSNPQDITTYVARHSYATVLKRANVSTEYIKEALGHQDIRTTETYLDSFGDNVLDKMDNDYL